MLRLGCFGFGLLLAQTACSGSDDTASPKKTIPETSNIESLGGSGGLGGEGGASGAEQAGTAGIAGQLVLFGPLGTNCSAAKPCEGDLHCFAAAGTDFPMYSPAGGYCSKRCTEDSDCRAIDPTAFCAELFLGDDNAAVKICAPNCKLGDKHACGGRVDLACWPLNDTSGDGAQRACLPTCNHDELCPAGTVCDGYVNLCATTAPAGGLPLGFECNPAAEVDLCGEGFCIELDGGGVCSSYCRRGTFPQCGAAAGEASICGWVFPGDEDAGSVDIGMCASTCACDADCAMGTHCVLHVDRQGMSHSGICTVGATVGIATCPG